MMFSFLRYTKNGEPETHALEVKQALMVTRVVQILLQLHYSGIGNNEDLGFGKESKQNGILDHYESSTVSPCHDVPNTVSSTTIASRRETASLNSETASL